MSHYRVGAFLCLAFCVAYGIAASRIPLPEGLELRPLNAQTYPMALAVLGAAVAMLIIVMPRSEAELPVSLSGAWMKLGVLVSLAVIYAAVLQSVGMFLATVGFLAAGFFLLGERRPHVLVVLPFAVSGIFQILLRAAIGIPLADPVLRLIGVAP